MKRQGSADALKSQSEFYKRIKKDQFAPVYLFEGAEIYLREEALKKLTATAIDESVLDFNYAAVSVAQGDLNEAIGLAMQFPMISERRMVVVRDFETINDETQLEVLKDYLRAPAETTVLVFVSPGLDNRRSISTILRKSCEVVTFAPLDEREGAPNWVREYATRAGCSIDPGSASYLVGMVGVDLMRLSNEIEKLIAYAGEKGRITREEIDRLVRYSREHSNFDLTDAIVDGDRQRALNLLEHIFANTSDSPQTISVMIIGAVASNYRRMLMAKELMRQNAPNSEVAKAVGMSPYAVTYLNERARKIDGDRIRRGISRIAQADVALKSSQATPRLQLELLICELT